MLLPETIDFAWTHPSSKTESCSIPGKHSDFFCSLAQKYSMFICVGLTEKIGDKNYNTAILINRNGEIILKYSKINLLTVEHDFYEIGQSLNVVDTEFGKIGINICADNYSNSLAIGHTLAKMGAQIILSPSSWTVEFSLVEGMDPYRDKWQKPLYSLASIFNVLVVSTTAVGYVVGGPYEGKKMVGCSLAINKTGVLSKGQFNEFAGELIVLETEIPQKSFKGTELSDFVEKQGVNYYPNNLYR